jgi:curli biogenesis system outer membrane secretion channel CsgG
MNHIILSMLKFKSIYFIFSVFLISCSTSQKTVNISQDIQEQAVSYDQIENKITPLKRVVAIARFSNETQYSKGVFYDKDNDPTSKQASDILATKLASTNKFILLERDDLNLIVKEQQIAGIDKSTIAGAQFLILGSITEFGRKNVGDVNAFSRSKTQIVEAGVSLRLVDVSSGQIIYSEEAKGQAETSNKTVMGMGERTDYDQTLNDKAISAAISQLVENVVNKCMDIPWFTEFLAEENGQLYIAGGKSMGIKADDIFSVYEKGKKVKNPQTGLEILLPGKKVDEIIVLQTIGQNENEISITKLKSGNVEINKLQDYIIKEN